MAVGRGRFPRIGGGQGYRAAIFEGMRTSIAWRKGEASSLYAEMVVILAEL